ncbi:MAG: NAD(P)H-dependent oxidoreductase [Mailhella sp.]|nr:NAD(P)H-dependent oxidoreductase [Mailhella sp.]
MNGNSAFCASLIQNAMRDSRVFFQWREVVPACIGCGFCDNKKGLCKFSLQEQDTVDKFYQELFQAEKAVFIAPIYFYHVPATFKAFLDRSQAWFALAQEQKPAQNLCADLILLGAREKGDRLFEGAKLSIRYALHSICL